MRIWYRNKVTKTESGKEKYENEAPFSGSGVFLLPSSLEKIEVHSGGGIYRQLLCRQKKKVYFKRDLRLLFNTIINVLCQVFYDVNREEDTGVLD